MMKEAPRTPDAPDQLTARWGALVAILLAALVLEPLSGSSRITEALSIALFQIAIVGALFVSATPGRFRLLCLGISAVWFVASLVSVAFFPFHGLVATLSVGLLLASLVATFGNLIRRDTGDLEGLLAAVFGYLMLTMVWAVLFVQIERANPGSFALSDPSDLSSTMIYYSLVTITTLGYGDIIPISPLARVAAGLEAVIGLLYVAVMIGSIVGTYQTRPKK